MMRAALAALLMACAAMQAADPAHLVFYCPGQRNQDRGRHESIKIDGDKAVHKLSINHVWRTNVTPGNHFIYGDSRKYGRNYPLESGKTYYFRVEYLVTSGFLSSDTVRAVPVPAEVAMGEMTGFDEDQP